VEDAVCILELVDSVERIQADYRKWQEELTAAGGQYSVSEPSTFKPGWCSLEFVEGAFSDNDGNPWGVERTIPVIVYGAKADHQVNSSSHEGVLRLAAPRFFYAAWTEFGTVHIYTEGEEPPADGLYGNINGSPVVGKTEDDLIEGS
jgi:hypothetical protein